MPLVYFAWRRTALIFLFLDENSHKTKVVFNSKRRTDMINLILDRQVMFIHQRSSSMVSQSIKIRSLFLPWQAIHWLKWVTRKKCCFIFIWDTMLRGNGPIVPASITKAKDKTQDGLFSPKSPIRARLK